MSFTSCSVQSAVARAGVTEGRARRSPRTTFRLRGRRVGSGTPGGLVYSGVGPHTVRGAVTEEGDTSGWSLSRHGSLLSQARGDGRSWDRGGFRLSFGGCRGFRPGCCYRGWRRGCGSASPCVAASAALACSSFWGTVTHWYGAVSAATVPHSGADTSAPSMQSPVRR